MYQIVRMKNDKFSVRHINAPISESDERVATMASKDIAEATAIFYAGVANDIISGDLLAAIPGMLDVVKKSVTIDA